MIGHIFNTLFGQDHRAPPLAAPDAEIAIAALLVRVARADDCYTEAERIRIDHILMRRRGLSETEAASRRIEAEELEAQAPDTVRFTRMIKDRIALDDRVGVIAAMWETTYADGDRSADEEAMVRLAAGLLGINDRDSALARQQVLRDMGISPT